MAQLACLYMQSFVNFKVRRYKNLFYILIKLITFYFFIGIGYNLFRMFSYPDTPYQDGILPHIEFRRNLASKLLKAAEDVSKLYLE